MSPKFAVLAIWFMQIRDLDHADLPFPPSLAPFIPMQLFTSINFGRT